MHYGDGVIRTQSISTLSHERERAAGQGGPGLDSTFRSAHPNFKGNCHNDGPVYKAAATWSSTSLTLAGARRSNAGASSITIPQPQVPSLGPQWVLRHPLGQKLKGVAFVLLKSGLFEACFFEERLQLPLFEFDAGVGGTPEEFAVDEALREGVCVGGCI